MTDNITLVGVVATPPKSIQTNSPLSIVTFRLASSQRRYDRTRNVWVEADTNWYTVTAFRQLAEHAEKSLSKGDRVIVSGRLRVRSWETGDRSGTNVEVDAEALGPDLLFGTTTFSRTSVRPSEETREQDHEAVANRPEPASPFAPAPAAAETWATPGASPAPQPTAATPPVDGARELVGAAAASSPAWNAASDEAPF